MQADVEIRTKSSNYLLLYNELNTPSLVTSQQDRTGQDRGVVCGTNGEGLMLTIYTTKRY